MELCGYVINSAEALILLQIGIEVLLVLLVIILLSKFRKGRVDPFKDNVSNILNLIQESDKICRSLSANLVEKKALADKLLFEIDSRIQKLGSLNQPTILAAANSGGVPTDFAATSSEFPYESILELERCGLSVEQIAERLSVTKGEIELVQRLAKR